MARRYLNSKEIAYCLAGLRCLQSQLLPTTDAWRIDALQQTAVKTILDDQGHDTPGECEIDALCEYLNCGGNK